MSAAIEHWRCRECGTFDGPKTGGDCDVCFDRDGNLVQVEYLVPSATHWGAVDLLRDVATAGISYDEPRVSYVEVQIDRATWDALAAYRAQS